MTDPINTNLAWARAHFSLYDQAYVDYAKYYYGDHPLKISDEVRDIFKKFLSDIRDNLCPLVCDTLSDRLTLTGFTSTDETLSKWATKLWEDLKLESRSATVHADGVLMGDSYVIVWPDPSNNKLARIYPQKTRNIAVRYEDNGAEDIIAEAVKMWAQKLDGKDILRITRYLPDRIERYYTENTGAGMPDSTDGLEKYGVDGEWTFHHDRGRVPVFRFANSLKNDVFAQSEIKDVMPHQDIINKTLVDMTVGAEFQGLPQRWVTGLTVPIDPETGKPVKKFTNKTDRIWAVGDKEVTFGQFDAADLEQFLKVLDNERTAVSRVSRTPLHHLMLNTGDFPSGEALKTAEAPLIAKVKKRISVWGEVWEQIIETCAQIEGVNYAAKLDSQWVDASPRSEAEVLTAAMQKKSIGVSQRQILKEIGYSDKDIDKMLQENEEQAVKNAERAAASFNSGRGV